MTTYALIAAAALVVGLFIGTVGVGGILLIPALTYLGGLTVHTAAATALFTFVFTGILGTVLFQRRGSIDWGLRGYPRAESICCAWPCCAASPSFITSFSSSRAPSLSPMS